MEHSGKGGRVADIDPPDNLDVVAIVLDNGQTIWCMEGSYKEYQPLDETGKGVMPPKIYFLRPESHPKLEMIGFTRHIIATYYK